MQAATATILWRGEETFMTNTNAEQTIITLLPHNDAAVICRHKSFLA